MSSREEFIPIGIASSVAKASGFDWIKTIEIAEKLSLQVIQFHLNQYKPEFNWQNDLIRRFEQIYIHLSAELSYSHPFINLIKESPNKPLLIQHQRFLDQEDISFFIKNSFLLGFENDNRSKLNDYFYQLQKLHSTGLNLSAIVDLPRFYHQFQNNHKEDEIFNHILKILKWCKTNEIPIVVHAIDIADYQSDYDNWVPVFEGILPWNDFFSFIIEDKIQIKSIIFEYEDVPNTEKSVYSLRKWFDKKF